MTEMVENIFAQFDESNNKFDAVNIDFVGEDKSVANFAFNEKTTGNYRIYFLYSFKTN